MSHSLLKTLQQKQSELKALFADCQTREEMYQKIMDLGKELPKLDPLEKQEENRVSGCQSIMHLRVVLEDGLLYFSAESDALISAGLAALLICVYSGEKPEVILKADPIYLKELLIAESLSPNRANGLYSILLKMKQQAVKFLLPQG